MRPQSILLLNFHPERNDLSKGKELRDGLSIVLQMGETLWVANDETISLERLTLAEPDKNKHYTVARDHKQFALSDYLQLPAPPGNDPADLQEVDIEGLAVMEHYLWIAGSHSLKRKKPASKDAKKAHKQLSKVSKEGNRYLLARIPLVPQAGTFELAKETAGKKKRRTAARLRGDVHGNDLTKALEQDEHLGPFLAIPGKDNGFDIEGLAAIGKRLYLGLRGPVLRGWAIILEVEPAEDSALPATLVLNPIGPQGRPYRKHFLDLGGLGIRDLCAEGSTQGSDLLILAGPTMDLDGPVSVFRWRGGATSDRESVVAAETLERVLDLPFGEGVDHAEGISLFSSEGGKTPSLLVVYDAASANRQIGESTLVADVFALPKRGKSTAP